MPTLWLRKLLATAVSVVVSLETIATSEDTKPDGWVGFGNTDEAFIEDGVDKSPVRGPDLHGAVSNRSLADDASFKRPAFADAFYSDPACDNAGPVWVAYRERMSVVYETVEEDEDMKALTALSFFNDMGFRTFKRLDAEANACFLGVCATLYHLARHRMLVENMYNSAVVFAKSLDRFVSSIHPSKFDDLNQVHTGVPLWPVTDYMIGKLQLEIAKASAGRAHDHNCGSQRGCVKSEKPMHGNAFHALPDDVLPAFAGDHEDGQIRLGDAFKIFVYDAEDYVELRALTAGAGFCRDNQWGFEVLLHQYFVACDCRTDDPEEADFFFVPQYTACHLNVKTFDEEGSNALFESLVPKLRYFRRTNGRDHIFVWGAGFAVDGPFRSWRSYIRDSIFLMTETEYWNPYTWQTEKNFNFAKDIVLPGRISVREIKQHDDLAVPMELREFTADFVGWNRPLHTAQGDAESPRQRLLKWAAKYPDMHVRQDVPYAEAVHGSINSRFCLVPRGKSAWSSRLFRTLFGKCVPVLLNDDYELPFPSLLGNAENWLIRWPMREVNDDLAELLQNFELSTLKQMVRNAVVPKCWYAWPPPTIDATHYELQEGDLDGACPNWRTQNAYVAVVAMLRQKVRTTKSSHHTFYRPDVSTGALLLTNESLDVM